MKCTMRRKQALLQVTRYGLRNGSGAASAFLHRDAAKVGLSWSFAIWLWLRVALFIVVASKHVFGDQNNIR